jgi:tRNA threonylcarbamoyl adenosine modification protein YeaZ
VKLLALDGALGPFSAALDLDGTWSTDRSATSDALERGLGRVDALLRAAGVPLAGLDRLAVGVGPGSFTGIRIVLSFAKSLAFATGLPLVGVSSYDALTPASAPERVLTVVRGRAGIICARLRTPAGDRTACGTVGTVLDELLGASPREPLAVCGDTEDVQDEIGKRGGIVRALANRADIPAVAVAEIARCSEASPSAHALAPDYGELPVVTAPKARA